MTHNVVIGAGGPTGIECVKRLLAVTDLPVRAVVRSVEKHKKSFQEHPKLELVQGDITNKDSLVHVLRNAKGVIVTASGSSYMSAADVDYKGVEKVAAICSEHSVERVVLVSSQLVTPQHRWNPIRMMLNNLRYSLMDNKFKGEEALRASNVSYTIVRPCQLTNAPAGGSHIISGQGDKLGGDPISRADVAAVCVEALHNPGADRVTVEVGAKGKPQRTYQENLVAIFEKLQRNT